MKSFHQAIKKIQYGGIGQTHKPYNKGSTSTSSRFKERAEKISPFGSAGGSHGLRYSMIAVY